MDKAKKSAPTAQPLVSICIGEYNAERFAGKTLDNLLAQTYPNIEIILVDDASTDHTADVLREYAKKYPDKIQAYFQEKNGGVGAGRNAALAHARGDYIFFCDSDDLLTPDCIEALVSKAKECDFPDLVIGGFTKVDRSGNVLFRRTYKTADIALRQSFSMCGKIIKRQFIEEHYLYSPTGVILDDALYQARLVPYAPTVAAVPNCGYLYVQNPTSVTHRTLNGFVVGRLDAGFDYLLEGYNGLATDVQKQCMMYFIARYVAWHLLRSGTGIGGKKTVEELTRAKARLERDFPAYKHLNYISLFKPKNSRRSVRLVTLAILLMMKLHLDKAFFYLYGTFDFSRFWPHM